MLIKCCLFHSGTIPSHLGLCLCSALLEWPDFNPAEAKLTQQVPDHCADHLDGPKYAMSIPKQWPTVRLELKEAILMTVRRKTLLIISVTCLGLIAGLYTASRWFMLAGFIKIEQTLAQENIRRVLNVLDQDIAAIDRFTYDRASIEETYYGMSTRSPDLLHWLMGRDATGTIQTRRLNFVILMDNNGQVIESRGYDRITKSVIAIPDSLMAHLTPSDPLIQAAANC